MNFVFDQLPKDNDITNLISNPYGYNVVAPYGHEDAPYWYEWGFDVNTQLLFNNNWIQPINPLVECTLSSDHWDLFSPVTVIPGVNYTLTAKIKLGTATNCCITVVDSDKWQLLAGKSFDNSNGLSTSEWKTINLTIPGSKSDLVHIHIGALDNFLLKQSSGTVFIKDLAIKSIDQDIEINRFCKMNGSYKNIITSNINFIELSQLDQHADEFNVYPIVITTAEYEFTWPLLKLSKKIIDLVNDDKLKILLLCVYEPTNSNVKHINEQVQLICNLQKITRIENIIFATTDSNIEKLAQDYSTTTSPKYKDVNAYAHTTKSLLLKSKHTSVDWLATYCNNFHNKSHIFLYLNNRNIFPRYLLCQLLKYKDLLKYSIYSWRSWDNLKCMPGASNTQLFKNTNIKTKDEEFYKFVEKNPNIPTIKIEDDEFVQNGDPLSNGIYINQRWIANTYFSVVIETHDRGSSHVTEKIYKLMFYCHPFIVLGAKNHLAAIRRYGFKTFPELFDESYDTMEPGFEKYKFISDQIEYYTTDAGKEKLKQLLPALKDKLEFNRNHLLSLSVDDVWNSLPNLYKD